MTATVSTERDAGHRDGNLTAWTWAEERDLRDRNHRRVKVVGRVVGESPRLAKAVRIWRWKLAKVTVGKSEVAPGKGDRRFADPTWSDKPRLTGG